jgi:hypothetical protein
MNRVERYGFALVAVLIVASLIIDYTGWMP